MKLTPEEVTRIVHRLLEEWKREQLVSFHDSDRNFQEKMSEIFLKELRVEEDLNKEIETLLQKYEKQFESGALDHRKMFNMVKAQLVKDRRIVL